MVNRDTPLKNFEKWLLDQNLKPKDFVSRLDRFLSKIGYKGAPLIYLNFIQFTIFLFLWLGFFLPLVTGLVIGLVLAFFLKVSLVEVFFIDFKYTSNLDVALCVLSLLFISSLVSLFFQFKKKKLPRLPPWKTFIK